MAEDPSRIRRQLLDIHEEARRILDPILEERGPLIRGFLGTRARVCGKPSCRCARGELHSSKYLSASDGGQTRQVHIPGGDEVRVLAAVERYRRIRQARSQLAEKLGVLTRRQLELVDRLCVSLLEPYPPDNPLPAPKARGRQRKGERRDRRG
jgi:hypothetical protein